jgi:hypothetical protein
MVMEEVFSTAEFQSIINIYKIEKGDHPIVNCTRLSRDDQGVYQEVWIELDAWE